MTNISVHDDDAKAVMDLCERYGAPECDIIAAMLDAVSDDDFWETYLQMWLQM